MKLSQMCRIAFAAITMLILSSGLDTKGFAQPNSPQGIKNIVLVHGAWADGSCWSKVIAMLEAKGLHVVAVQNPLTSLADDVAATKRIIALQDGPVILVGHSYAGVVITEAGNDPKVVGLVYVAAFAPGDGESINSVSKPYPPAPLGGELRPDAQGFLTATPKGIAEDMAQDLPATRCNSNPSAAPRLHSISAQVSAIFRLRKRDLSCEIWALSCESETRCYSAQTW